MIVDYYRFRKQKKKLGVAFVVMKPTQGPGVLFFAPKPTRRNYIRAFRHSTLNSQSYRAQVTSELRGHMLRGADIARWQVCGKFVVRLWQA